MLIDSHFHLTDEKYKNKEQSVVEDAKKEGVSKLVTIGTSLQDNEKVIDIVQKFPDLYGTVGIYPHENLDLNFDEIKERFTKQINNPKIVGIGECGIDKSNYGETRELIEQIDIFKMQIEASLENNLPLIIHNREGDKEVLQILKEYKEKNPNLKGIAHCYVSTWETAKALLELGFMISFSGIITYPSGKDILETVKNVPLEKFLVETDAPYLAPQGHRGEVNVPKYVRITALKIAEVKGITIEEVEKYSYENTCRIFGIN